MNNSIPAVISLFTWIIFTFKAYKYLSQDLHFHARKEVGLSILYMVALVLITLIGMVILIIRNKSGMEVAAWLNYAWQFCCPIAIPITFYYITKQIPPDANQKFLPEKIPYRFFLVLSVAMDMLILPGAFSLLTN